MKTRVITSTKVILATLVALTFNGCAKESELDTIKDAQMCLNKATTATAQSCVSKISSINTDQANQLKCAAYFIQEGYGTPTKLIEAIENANTGGSTSSVNMIAELSFSTEAQSTLAFNVCNTSGIPVYSQLSSLVQISTLAKTVGSLGPSATPSDYATAIASIPAATLGNLVTTTYEASCNGGSSSGDALQEYCQQLSGALAESSPADIGACVQYKLTGNSYPGLPCPAN